MSKEVFKKVYGYGDSENKFLINLTNLIYETLKDNEYSADSVCACLAVSLVAFSRNKNLSDDIIKGLIIESMKLSDL